MIWLTGGSLAIALLMIGGLLALVLWQGLKTFWPVPLVKMETVDGRVFMGEITRQEGYRLTDDLIEGLDSDLREPARQQQASIGSARRSLLRTGNYRLTQQHFAWVNDYELAERSLPEWGMVLERLEWGRFYGFPLAFVELHYLDGAADPLAEVERLRRDSRNASDSDTAGDGELRFLLPNDELVVSGADLTSAPVAVARVHYGAEVAWEKLEERHGGVRRRWLERRKLEKDDAGELSHREDQARLKVRSAELAVDESQKRGNAAAVEQAQRELERASEELVEVRRLAEVEFARIRSEIDDLNRENSRFRLLMRTAGEADRPAEDVLLPLDGIVRAYPANRLGFTEKTGVYLARWWEFLIDEPREANSEGGVFPAIFGTVTMTLLMTLAVVPIGVLAALYLREYAKAGPLISGVRIAVNNLAGVPSIVFGVFGLGFFCYLIGASIDQLLFAERLPNPTFAKGGILWAALTLALLTLPVVIVATEESLAAVPRSMREGSYACGASKWQTIQRIVLPRALPGIITGAILAIARGAGEVAPLMLVGAVKLAPELPIDSLFPFLHPERSFMHLGFHIYDVGFQSQNSEAAKPMVFTTTLLLILIVTLLNLAAIRLRTRLRRKFMEGKF